ncbi:hypothetical protein [Aerococcus sanguinicola]|nr:hypothetical protein [Aerococcus sanguinicola]
MKGDSMSLSQNKQSIQRLTLTALLTALAILIPMVMPIKVVLGPASYTLASHLPIVLAIFMGPAPAAFVALASGIGFFLAGFPFVIGLRGLSHVFFATFGAYYFQKHPGVVDKLTTRTAFSFVLAFIHALAEVVVVYLVTGLGAGTLAAGYFTPLFVFVGLGGIVHGMVDFELGYQTARALDKAKVVSFFKN